MNITLKEKQFLKNQQYIYTFKDNQNVTKHTSSEIHLFTKELILPAVADSAATTPPPSPRSKIFSISCSFSQNLENHMLAPSWRVGAPSFGESWFRPCPVIKFCHCRLKSDKKVLKFFLNRAELSLNSVTSANSGNLINDRSMNWAQFKAGIMVSSWDYGSIMVSYLKSDRFKPFK